MAIKRYAQAAVAGICTVMLSGSLAMAAANPASTDVVHPVRDIAAQIESKPVESDGGATIRMGQLAPDEQHALRKRINDLGPDVLDYYNSTALLERHAEVDHLLFERYADEIAKQEFMVTHTGPQEDYIEIGISPYSEEHVDFLYELLGNDMIRVVEGQQAHLMGVPAESSRAADMPAVLPDPDTPVSQPVSGGSGETATTDAIDVDIDARDIAANQVRQSDDPEEVTATEESADTDDNGPTVFVLPLYKPLLATIGAFIVIKGVLSALRKFRR